MLEEISKRPFARPLFLWITGILLQQTIFCPYLSLLILWIPFLYLLITYGLLHKPYGGQSYSYRWNWGVVFAFLLLSLSIQITDRAEQHDFSSPPDKIQQVASEVQRTLVDSFDKLHLRDDEKSVLATVTLGYKQAMNREVRRSFSTAGVAHILAVSGFHVAIVCGFLSFILGFIPKNGVGRWGKYLSVITLLWSFVYVTGLAASAVRAGVMLSLYLTGKVLRRTTDSYNTLAAAAFCMLAYNPFYLFDIGFQLSYLAVFFILYLQPFFKNMIEVKNPLLSMPWDWITISVAAQTGTVLLCLYYFGQTSSVFLFTNLPLTLIASLLIPMALLWLLLPVWVPGFGLLQEGVEMLVRWMVKIVDAFSHVPGAAFTFRIDFVHLISGYVILLLFLRFLKTRRPKWLLLSLLLLLIILFAHLIKKLF